MQISRSNSSDSFSFSALFDSFEKKSILVIGDLMLDTYWEGEVSRISPEAPVPVLNLRSTSHRLGGAANVALNLSRLGCKVSMMGVVGDDMKGELLTRRSQEQDIDTKHIIVDANRKTTEKIRIIGRHQHLLRVDNEDEGVAVASWAGLIVEAVDEYLKNHAEASVILQDYDKGFFSTEMIQGVLDVCKRHQVMVSVDPKRKHFFDYRCATIFKPNLKEMFNALGLDISNNVDSHLKEVATQLRKRLDVAHLVVTLSEKGILWVTEKDNRHFAIKARQVADVSGAGDTTIAVLTLVYALTRDMPYSIQIANIAAGIVCGKVGTASVNRKELYEECQRKQVR